MKVENINGKVHLVLEDQDETNCIFALFNHTTFSRKYLEPTFAADDWKKLDQFVGDYMRFHEKIDGLLRNYDPGAKLEKVLNAVRRAFNE